jgi:hypothetical protein
MVALGWTRLSAGTSGSTSLRSVLSSANLGLACLAALVGFTIWSFSHHVVQSDDAFISYRYARNLADGHGLVFNTGERVEGITNLLWTVLIAAGMALGGEGEALGHWFSVGSAAATMVATYFYAAGLLPRNARLLAVLAPVGMLASNAFLAWTTSGLETPFFVFLVVASCLAMLHGRRYLAAILCYLAAMTRPEAVALAACLLGYDAVFRIAVAARLRHMRGVAEAIGPCVCFALLLCALEAFRLWYYGDLLPNTFYAKVGGIPVSRGAIYLRNFLVDGPALLLPGACITAWALPAFRPAFLFFLLMSAYVVAIGGDTYWNGRFLVPALPMLLAGAIAGACILFRQTRLAGYGLGLAVPACILWSLYGYWPQNWGPPDEDFFWAAAYPRTFPHSAKRAADRVHYFMSTDEDAIVHSQLDLWRALDPKPTLVALIGIGKLGYWGMDFRVLDLLGLTDKHIARSMKTEARTIIVPGHSRTDSVYVFSRKPDVIQLSCALPLPVAADLCANPDLARSYHEVKDIGYVRNGICTGGCR